MTAPATPPIRPSAISTNRTSASVAPSEESMPRARCLRWAMTVNEAVATRPMKTRPSTEMMSTMVAGERMESSGVGVLTTALFGRTSPAADAAAESRDSPRKIRTWLGLAELAGGDEGELVEQVGRVLDDAGDGEDAAGRGCPSRPGRARSSRRGGCRAGRART